MIIATGGDSGFRDIGLLDSALSNAFATFDGLELYKSVEEKCASICFTASAAKKKGFGGPVRWRRENVTFSEMEGKGTHHPWREMFLSL